MTYKPEIDGLRTIAVMLVLFCHMQLGIPGGFIGVDIFFVISGFLITSTLLYNVEKSQFSVWRFYGKRFIRLYPALIVMVLAAVGLALLLFDAKFVELVARTAKYAITSSSNIFFTRSSQGYFDSSALLQPFLHTWSLGVEWQFYLIWPFLVWGALKVSRRLLIILLVLITIISLISSQWMIGQNANQAYYQMPFRAFELSIGALLVFVYHKNMPANASKYLLWAGIFTMIICAFIYTPKTPFPGLYALIPCLATVACIYGGKNVDTGNILRQPLMIYIGKISYSAYLVHWPLIVYYSYYIYRDLFLFEKIALLFISLILGAMSYHWIEQKFSWKQIKHKLATCLGCIAFIALCIPAFNYIYNDGKGLSWRIPAHPYQQDQYELWGGYGYLSNTVGTIGQKEQTPIAILTGDSMAGSLTYGIDQELQKENEAMMLIFEPGCLVLATPIGSEACQATSTQVVKNAVEKNLPVVLTQAWAAPFHQSFMLQNRLPDNKTQDEYHLDIEKNLDGLKAAIGNNPLIIIGSVPYRRWGGGDKECFSRPDYIYRACERQLTSFYSDTLATHKTNAFLREYAQQHDGVYYIDVEEQTCPGNTCSMDRSAKIFFDSFHLSQYGSNEVAPHIIEELKIILEQPVDAMTGTHSPEPNKL